MPKVLYEGKYVDNHASFIPGINHYKSVNNRCFLLLILGRFLNTFSWEIYLEPKI